MALYQKKVMLSLSNEQYENAKIMASEKWITFPEMIRGLLNDAWETRNRRKFGYAGTEKKPSASPKVPVEIQRSDHLRELLSLSDAELTEKLTECGQFPPPELIGTNNYRRHICATHDTAGRCWAIVSDGSFESCGPIESVVRQALKKKLL